MFLQLISFLLVGSLSVYIIRKFPFHELLYINRLFEDGKFLRELFDCRLCLGVWVFAFLSYILQINFIEWMFDRTGLIIVDQILTGAMASFVCHVFAMGWMTGFGTTVIDSWSE